MLISMENNAAFIDGANLHKGIENLGWHLNYARFRIWLSEKYDITKAYIFIGFMPNKNELYIELEKVGYILVYKEITYGLNGKVKGNCDADLVLQAAIDYYEKNFDKAVIVSSDGDYASLVNFLNKKEVFQILLSPGDKCSNLLRKLNIRIVYLGELRARLEFLPNKKAPDGDETP